MIKGVAFSRWRGAFCAIGICAAVSVTTLHHHIANERLKSLAQIEDQERKLTRLAAENSGCAPSDVDALRAQVQRIRVELGPADSWNQLVHVFGNKWKAEVGTRDDREGFSVQIGTLRLQSATIDDWPHIVELIKAAENHPGVGVIGFEMRTTGDRERRSVDFVKVVLMIQSLRS